jgi:inosine-uridine nucleoside N-ribohydrolase
LLWAVLGARNGELDLAALTTVGGNVSPEATYDAAFKTLKAAGCCATDEPDCTTWQCPPVGRANPEVEWDGGDGFMGADGLGGLGDRFPDVSIPYSKAESSVKLLIDTLDAHPERTVNLVALGPLTNLARAEKERPGILKKAKEIICMGGAFNVPGNIMPDAEFNVFMDPESYRDVLQVADVTFLPLDVTAGIHLDGEHIKRLSTFVGSTASPLSQGAAGELLGFVTDLWGFLVTQTLNFKQSRGKPAALMHDAAAVGYLMYPGVFSLRRTRVHVDCSEASEGSSFGSSGSRGRTSFDQRMAVSESTNALVATAVDKEMLMAAFVEDLQGLLEHMA